MQAEFAAGANDRKAEEVREERNQLLSKLTGCQDLM